MRSLALGLGTSKLMPLAKHFLAKKYDNELFIIEMELDIVEG